MQVMEMTDKTKGFIDKAKNIHGDKYDYSSVDYANARTKVTIICPMHGAYLQSPDNHLRKRGCPKCAGKGWVKRDFLQESIKVHGNKYDYSNVYYHNKNTHVEIICKEHGIFRQLPSIHLNGSGCPKCAGKGYSFEEIINKANDVHGNKYKYLEIATEKNIKGKTRTYLTIYCPLHEHTWKATPDAHILKGTGCNLCGNDSSSESQRSDILDLKKRIEAIHPVYIVPVEQSYFNQNSNIIYICSEHGKQRGRAINLLNGQGCPVCGQESRNDFFRDDWEDVIRRIEEKYPEYHVYPDQSFNNHHSPIVYRCEYHGDKISNANTLLSASSGCDECGYKKSADSQRACWQDVIKKIKTINTQIVIPSDQNYKSVNDKIMYICDEHGEQFATPSKLMMGRGCPKCAIKNRNNYSDSAWCRLCGDRDAKLYWIRMKYQDEEWYKFGKTFQRIKDRWWELNKLNIEYEVLRVIIGEPEYICKLERKLHSTYKKWHYVPSITFGGHLTECLTTRTVE
jgi:hypothetical protein